MSKAISYKRLESTNGIESQVEENQHQVENQNSRGKAYIILFLTVQNMRHLNNQTFHSRFTTTQNKMQLIFTFH